MKRIRLLIPSMLLVALLLVATTPAQAIQFFHEPPFEAYKVSKGDTFWFIAKRYGLDVQELMRLNPNVDPYNMQVGSIIRLKPESTTAPSQASSFEVQVVQLVNQERAKYGLQPLAHRADLSIVARDKAKDMVVNNYFSHTSPTYGSPFDMMRAYGIRYNYAGENIAKGYRSPQEVVRAWMNSEGHRRNILNPNFTGIGVGYYNGAWVQMFVG